MLAAEPAGQLVPDATERLFELPVSVQEKSGPALVVVSHDRDLAERFDDVRRLENGSLG